MDPALPRRLEDRTAGHELLWDGKNGVHPQLSASPRLSDALDGPFGAPPLPERNRLFWGDNLPLMRALLQEFRGRIDLVYLDPPFNTGQEFRICRPLGDGAQRAVVETPAYQDAWETGAYLQMLHERLLVARDLLAETGSLVVHVDWRVGHLVQVVLDEVFGPGERAGPGRAGFRNEIIWGYGGGGSTRNAYRRKHDNLFWYTRSDRWTFNPQYRPYTEGTRQRGLTAVKGPRYALREEGATLESWWTGPEVGKILSPTARENLKYPTQKPEALLHRILQGHSNPGDLVADFFCGSGTTGAVAERLGRRWIMADASRQAALLSRKRLAALQAELAASGQPFRAFDCYSGASCGCVGVWVCGCASVAQTRPGHGDARVVAELVPDAGSDSTVRLRDYRPELPEGAPAALRERAERDGLEFVEYWAVDWQYDGKVFCHQWHASRAAGRRGMALQSEPYGGPAGRVDGRPAVKVVDVFGNEMVAVGLLHGQPSGTEDAGPPGVEPPAYTWEPP